MSALQSLLARVHRRLPGRARALPLVSALELARRARWLEPPAALDGHTFLLTVTDLKLDVPFRCEQGRFRLASADSGVPELTLRACVPDYLRLLAGQCDTDTLFFQRRLVIGGDTALGLEVKYWLDAAPRPAWLGAIAGKLAAGFAGGGER
ncbi:SCP2 sterol-binding domain-containing protein [Cupriavidus pinatubonensis]|uniref:ubiquinone anaerobic biosynthesis accessory factor UbiT n=1 Tax=Cupriavidus pinatubonensis TaxID=248026 RepID=UPI001125CF56|nr:SCP2 sterol-binding domain-containing protein [Cupriavidus pinatubonensis]QYY27946.1 SCP2 sterol-binding domain-containing protein [Cupriavidus pinatubonensis]TPQ41655.1 SCP2 domain-containing protein [Cupriavidus pinatubonensis]